jgi:flavorubredoxin
MHCTRKVTDDLYWVGADDRRLTLFENIHPIPRGVSYNAYLLLDEKTVLFDATDWSAGRQLVDNLDYLLQGRPLDYIVVDHLEPDHGATLDLLLLRWPEVKILCSQMAIKFMTQFNLHRAAAAAEAVKEGDVRSFGKHEIQFVAAPMVHWPEVLVSFDKTSGVLFSADAFGTFGALNGKLFADEVDFDRDWMDDARRYYTNIVGKYGSNVQTLLKKAAGLDLKMICSLHGPVWRKDLAHFVDKYDKWSRYEPEKRGVLIVYGSMYGDTENAAQVLATKLAERGITDTAMYDVSSTPVSQLVAETFRYSHLVLASVTYNLNIFPPMHNFLSDLKMLNMGHRTAAILECGTWAIKSGCLMCDCLAELPEMQVLSAPLTVKSSLQEEQEAAMDALADTLAASVKDN